MPDQPTKQPTGRTQVARLAGLGQFVKYPIARLDIEYQDLSAEGRALPGLHKLQLVVTDHEARQIANKLVELADKLAASGGSKQ